MVDHFSLSQMKLGSNKELNSWKTKFLILCSYFILVGLKMQKISYLSYMGFLAQKSEHLW